MSSFRDLGLLDLPKELTARIRRGDDVPPAEIAEALAPLRAQVTIVAKAFLVEEGKPLPDDLDMTLTTGYLYLGFMLPDELIVRIIRGENVDAEISAVIRSWS